MSDQTRNLNPQGHKWPAEILEDLRNSVLAAADRQELCSDPKMWAQAHANRLIAHGIEMASQQLLGWTPPEGEK